jgi:hypothetical protein
MRLLTWTAVAVVALAAGAVVLRLAPVAVRGQTSAGKTTAGRAEFAPATAWGEPDLQGIWTLETDTPLQRPPRFATVARR